MPTPGQEAANLIREEIARLTRALAMLEGNDERYSPEPREPVVRARRGRPAGGARQMSPEARERIAAAQRARWAASRQQEASAPELAAAEPPAEPQSPSQEVPQATEAAPDIETAEQAVKPPKRRK